jgi:hypothetical protein
MVDTEIQFGEFRFSRASVPTPPAEMKDEIKSMDIKTLVLHL